MIIVEGCDGAGKSTLIQRIREEFPELPLAQRVVSKDTEALVDLQAWVEKNLELGWQWTLFDRHRLISEPIYGSILRDYPQPGFDDPRWLFSVVSQFYQIKPIIIYCVPPWPVVEANSLITSQPRNVLQNFSKIYRAYVAKAATDRVLLSETCWAYDYTSSSLSYLLCELHRLFQERMRP